MDVPKVMQELDLAWEHVQIATTPDELRGHLEIGAVDGDIEHLERLEAECKFVTERCRLTDSEDIESIGRIYSLGRRLCILYRKAIQARLAGRIEEAMGYESRCSVLQPEFDQAVLNAAKVPETYFLTNAEEAYDYDYVRTLFVVQSKHGKDYRVIAVRDEYRFQNFQLPRYGSGLRQAHALDSEDAAYLFTPGTLEEVKVKLAKEV